MSSCFPVRRAPRASAALLLLAKISLVIPPVSAAIPARVSSALNEEGVIADVVAAQTAAAVVQIAVVIVADVLQVLDSNAARAVLGVPGMTAVTAAIPVRRAVRNSSAKC